MTLNQLEYFIHLARTGNVSQSARALGLSQPSLSRHISQLERTLGVMLFDRYHRPMRLTPAGSFLFEHSQKHTQALKEVIELTKNFHTTQHANTLSIGFVASVLYGLLPDIISTLKQAQPKLEIKLIEVSSDAQMSALKSGEIDVGFGRFLCSDALIQQIFLRHERFVVALPINHPLATRDADIGISLKELMDDTLILYHRTALPVTHNQTRDQLLNLFEQRKLTPKHTTQARDIQIALGLVSAGEGITLVPDSLKTVRTEQIHYHRLHHENATTPIYMNLLAEHTHPQLQALLDATYEIYEKKGITYGKQSIIVG